MNTTYSYRKQAQDESNDFEDEEQEDYETGEEMPLTIKLLHEMGYKLVNIKKRGTHGRKNSYRIVHEDTPAIGGQELQDFPEFIRGFYQTVGLDTVLFRIYQYKGEHRDPDWPIDESTIPQKVRLSQIS